VHALKVHAPGGSYPIVVGQSLLDRPEAYAALLPGRQVMVVTNSVVAPLYLDRVRAALGEWEHDALVLPDGEREKTLDTFSVIVDRLIAAGFNRDATIVALGGGVVGDVSGFAAACFHRGIACLQVPTTLLAQVDSSVGGKTAVNHPAGKNLIGAFHQPVGVLADVSTLETLPDREYRAGLAEVLKYGIGLDPAFFFWLERHVDALAGREPAAVEAAVAWSCAIKARVVAEDERERGARALLNLGHTFGHAVEAHDGYAGGWLHGEAVAVGMRMAAALACEEGRLEAADAQRINRLLDAAGLPGTPPPIPLEGWLSLMGRDKKVAGGRIRLVLPTAIGRSEITARYDDDALSRILAKTTARP
jgi:3-dehydroquinate synthase